MAAMKGMTFMKLYPVKAPLGPALQRLRESVTPLIARIDTQSRHENHSIAGGETRAGRGVIIRPLQLQPFFLT